MGKSEKRRGKLELLGLIKTCEQYKLGIAKQLRGVNYYLKHGYISRDEYRRELDRLFKGNNPKALLRRCDQQISRYRHELRSCESEIRSEKRNSTFSLLTISVTVLLIVGLGLMFFKAGFTGFAVYGPGQFVNETLEMNLTGVEFNASESSVTASLNKQVATLPLDYFSLQDGIAFIDLAAFNISVENGTLVLHAIYNETLLAEAFFDVLVDSAPDEVVPPESLPDSEVNGTEVNGTEAEVVEFDVEKLKEKIKAGPHSEFVEITNLGKSDNLFDLDIEFRKGSTVKGSARLEGLEDVSKLDVIQLDSLPNNSISSGFITTDVVAASSVKFSSADITLSKNGNVTAIVRCVDWDYVSFSCGSWEPTSIPFFDDGENITFTVDSFSAYAGADISNFSVPPGLQDTGFLSPGRISGAHAKHKDVDIAIGRDRQGFDTNYPSLRINKWHGEATASVFADYVSSQPSQLPNGLSWKHGNISDMEIYNTEDATEFDIVLYSKPSDNVFSFNVSSTNLEFFYQPPLDDEHGKDSCNATDCWDALGNIKRHRPENVVGSYAVYHSSQRGDYSALGGENYMAGKAFHIFRPRVFDAVNDSVWADLNIADGVMTVTVPQSFLSTAVYPVVIDPTFGYDAVGGTPTAISAGNTVGLDLNATSPAGASMVNNITVYALVYDTTTFRYGLYSNGATPGFLLDSDASAWNPEPDGTTWYTNPVDMGYLLVAGTQYWVGVGLGDGASFYYDSGSDTIEVASSILPSNWSGTTDTSNAMASVYVTYTPPENAREVSRDIYFYTFDDANEFTNYTVSTAGAWIRDTSERANSAKFDGATTNTKLTYNLTFDSEGTMNLVNYSSCTLSSSLFREAAMDSGEYVCMDYSGDNGTNWNADAGGGTAFCLDETVDPEGSWVTVSNTFYLGLNNTITARFRGTSNGAAEEGSADNLNMSCVGYTPGFTTNLTANESSVSPGQIVNFSAVGEGSNGYSLTVCKSDSITDGFPGTCANGNTACTSSAADPSIPTSCEYTIPTDLVNSQAFYGFVCNPVGCSTSTSVTLTVNNVYTVNLTQPTGGESHNPGDNIIVWFNYTKNNATITSGANISSIDVGGEKCNIITGLSDSLCGGFDVAGAGAVTPVGIALNSSDGSLWVVDNVDNFVYHFDGVGTNLSDGFYIGSAGAGSPYGIALNSSDNSFWVVDNSDDFVYHFSGVGTNLSDGFATGGAGATYPFSIAFDSSDGSLWVTDSADFVYHFSGTGANLSGGFYVGGAGAGNPNGITFDSSDDSFWVVDTFDDFVYHFDGAGTNLSDGFSTGSGAPYGLAFDFTDGSFWVTDEDNNFVDHFGGLEFFYDSPSTLWNANCTLASTLSGGLKDLSLNVTYATDNITNDTTEVGAVNIVPIFYEVNVTQPINGESHNPSDNVSVWFNYTKTTLTSSSVLGSGVSLNSIGVGGEQCGIIIGLSNNFSDGFYVGGAGAGNSYGLTLNVSDGSFWVVDLTDAFVYHFDSAGANLSDGFYVGGAGAGSPSSIAWNSSDDSFWVTDYFDDFVYHFDGAGTNLSDGFATGGAGANAPYGIAFNSSDGSLWVVDNADAFVYHFSGAGDNLSGGFDVGGAGAGGPYGITFDSSDNSFWVVDSTDAFVYHFDGAGTNLSDGFPVLGAGADTPTGIAFESSDNSLWVVDDADDFVYHFNRLEFFYDTPSFLWNANCTLASNLSGGLKDLFLNVTYSTDSVTNETTEVGAVNIPIFYEINVTQPINGESHNPGDNVSVWFNYTKTTLNSSSVLSSGVSINSIGVGGEQCSDTVLDYSSASFLWNANCTLASNLSGGLKDLALNVTYSTDSVTNDTSEVGAVNVVPFVYDLNVTQPINGESHNPGDALSVWFNYTKTTLTSSSVLGSNVKINQMTVGNEECVVGYLPGNNLSDGFPTGSAGSNSPFGIAWDSSDGSLWVADSTNSFVYHLDSSGYNLSNGFYTLSAGANNIWGVALNVSDGSFWVFDFTDSFIYHFDGAGTNLSDGFSPNGAGAAAATNIAWDSSDDSLWVVDNADDFVYHFDGAGNNLSGGFYVGGAGAGDVFGVGLDTSNGSFWVVDNFDDFVYHFDGVGTNLSDGFSVLGAGAGNPTGIAFHNFDRSFWVVDGTDDFVYHFSGLDFSYDSSSFLWNANCTLASNLSGGLKDLFLNVTYLTDGVTNDTTEVGAVNIAASDSTAPSVSLEAPDDNSTNITSNAIDFSYNVSEANTLSSCSLIIESGVDTSINVTDTAMVKDAAGQNLTSYLDNGDYNWTVNCTDDSNNIGTADWRNISINVINPPTIVDISILSSIDPVDNSNVNVSFSFLADDQDGISQFDNSSANATFTLDASGVGNGMQINASCTADDGGNNATVQNYSCSALMRYFDRASDWSVNATVADSLAASQSYNETFTYNSLTAINMTPTSMGWPAITSTSTDVLSLTNPIIVGNTGNYNVSIGSVNISAIDLGGETTTNQFITSDNFSINTASACNSGNVLQNQTSGDVAITGASLATELNVGERASDVLLYLCLEEVPALIPQQAYSTVNVGVWTIGVT